METVIQQVINALSLGGTYALLALGLAIVCSILGLVNFAHGDLMTVTGYVMYFLIIANVPFGLAVVLGIVGAIIVALAMERVAFRPLRGQGEATLMLSSFAVSLILEIFFQDVIGARPKAVPMPEWVGSSLGVFGIHIGTIQAVSAVTALVMLAVLTLFLNRTVIGLSLRAAARISQ